MGVLIWKEPVLVQEEKERKWGRRVNISPLFWSPFSSFDVHSSFLTSSLSLCSVITLKMPLYKFMSPASFTSLPWVGRWGTWGEDGELWIAKKNDIFAEPASTSEQFQKTMIFLPSLHQLEDCPSLPPPSPSPGYQGQCGIGVRFNFVILAFSVLHFTRSRDRCALSI